MTEKQRLAKLREADLNRFAKQHDIQTIRSTTTQEENKTMANPQTTQKPTQKTNTPPPAPPSNGSKTAADAGKGEKTKKEKRAKQRWVSPKHADFWVRSFKDVTDKHGAPKDPWGNTMVAKAGAPFGQKLSEEEKQARAKAKEADKLRKANMTDEEKLAEAKQRRAAKDAKKKQEADAMHKSILDQIMADISAGKIPGVKLV
jgi:hypothetical protein